MPSSACSRRLRRLIVLTAGLLALLLTAGSAAAADRVFWGAYDSSAIGAADLEGSGAQTVLEGAAVGGPWGTTVDAAAGRLYWADWDGDVIRYANLDGSSPGVLATPGATVASAYGLTLDPTSNTLYWANETGDSIQYARTDGSGGGALYCESGCGTILGVGAASLGMTIPDEMNDPLSTAIDPARGRIYWGNYLDGTIGVANLDGSGSAAVITPSGCPTELTKTYWVLVDGAAGHLYAGGRASGSSYPTQRMNLDGSGCIDLGVFPWYGFGAALSPTGDSLIMPDDQGDRLMRLSLGTAPTASPIATGAAAIDTPTYPVILATPTASVAPRLTASMTTVGATLTCAAPTWSFGSPGVNLYRSPQGATTYSWTRGGAAIPGSTQTLVADAVGEYRCVATAANGAGAGTSASAAVAISAPLTTTAPGRPRLRVEITAPAAARAGSTFTVTVEVSNTAAARASAPTTAVDVKTCATLPAGLAVARRNGGTVSGRTICWARSQLAAGATATYRVGVRATGRISGPLRIQGSATADNAAGRPVTTKSATRLRVVRPQPAEPVTG